MFDPFDEKSRSEVARAMKGMAKNADDPLIIGYFLANEQGLEDIPRAIPALDASWAAKRAFVKSLEKKYGTIGKFNAAWEAKESDFRALEAKGLAVTTKAAFADVNAFKEKFLEEYYSLIEREFRANDPNHMLIGNRWQPGTANDETLCRVAGRHMDVISINYYTAGVDRKFITRLYDWTGRKPQFWSEFYYTSTKESNCGPSGFDLATQKERGMAYRNYVEAAAELGFVTGIEWFTLIDQAATGRFFEGQNGERTKTCSPGCSPPISTSIPSGSARSLRGSSTTRATTDPATPRAATPSDAPSRRWRSTGSRTAIRCVRRSASPPRAS